MFAGKFIASLHSPPLHIMISRTDSIGDVVLTLPVARVLKDYFPGVRISFLGRSYTRPVIDACIYVDAYVGRDDFLAGNMALGRPDLILHVFPDREIALCAKKMKIPLRIGSTGRLYHWATCNRLVPLSRRNASLHEAQLNLRLLRALGVKEDFSLEYIGRSFGLSHIPPLEPAFGSLLHPGKYHLILHPRSHGSAREWGLHNFARLIRMLDPERYQLFISGTEKDAMLLKPLMEQVSGLVTDITGRMSLSQFMAFIRHCDGLVANSTGPLHIAAALGLDAFGIYPPVRPMHPGRWAPLGPGAQFFVADRRCRNCRNNPGDCTCMDAVEPEQVRDALDIRAESFILL